MQKSEKVDELAKALDAASCEFKAIHKDAENPYFKSKYAPLSTVVAATKDGLQNHGLSVIQIGAPVLPGLVGITTILLHTSGQWLSGDMYATPAKNDPQGVGSLITYLRRYAYCAILNLVADDDDDGNTASAPPPSSVHRDAQFSPPLGDRPQPTPAGKLSEAQIKRLFAIAKSNNHPLEEVRGYMKKLWNISSFDDLNKKQYDVICTAMEQPDFNTPF